MSQGPAGEKARWRLLGRGPGDFHDPGPHHLLPAGIAGDGENDLAVLGEDETGRRIGARHSLVAFQESRPDPQRVGRPAFVGQDERMVGRVDDAIVEFLARIGFDEVRLGLGTPDLAAASKFVTDEHQHRLPGLGLRDAGR